MVAPGGIAVTKAAPAEAIPFPILSLPGYGDESPEIVRVGVGGRSTVTGLAVSFRTPMKTVTELSPPPRSFVAMEISTRVAVPGVSGPGDETSGTVADTVVGGTGL